MAPLMIGIGLSVSGGAGSGGGAQFVQNAPTIALVGSRGMLPTQGTTDGNAVSGPTNDKVDFRQRCRIGRFSATKLRPLFVSGVIGDSGGSWFRQLNNLTIDWAIDTGATNFKAGDQVVLPASGKVIPNTQVLPADLGVGSFGAGAGLMFRGQVTLGAADTVYGGSARSVTTANQAENVLRSSGQAAQWSQAGDLSTTSRTALNQGFAMQGVLGEWVSSRDLSVGLMGDSIFFGSGEGNLGLQLHEGLTGGGMAARGLYAVGGAAKTVPWCKITNGGQRCFRAIEPVAKAILADYAPYLTDIICNYFYNDRQSGGSTAAEITSYLLELGRYCNSLGLRFHWTTPIPATSSTDAYATLANQTVNAGYAADAATVTASMTALFALGYAGGGITGGKIDVRASLVDSVETDKWVVTGAANYAVATDSVHPTPAGHALAGVPIGAYANALSIPA